MSRQEIQERAWQKMEQLLDKELPRRRPMALAFLPYAAVVSIIISVVGLFVLPTNQGSFNLSESKNPILVHPIEQAFPDFSLFQTNKENSINNNQEIAFANDFSQSEPTVISELPTQNTIQRTSTDFLSNSTPLVNPEFLIENENTLSNKKIAAKTKKSFSKVNKGRESASLNSSKKEETALISNQKQQQVFLLTPDIKKSFNPVQDMGMTSNGSIGFVSDNFEEYGLRLGFELQKPMTKNLNINGGIRYSVYEDDYSATYQTDTPEELLGNAIISRMNERSVSRSFVELPVYLDYEVNSNIKVKTGAALTYNKNKSESPGFTTQAILNNNYISEETKNEIGKLYADENGYLGEFLLGATLEVERVSFDVEATRGFINNQGIDNRNVVGMRISYKLGK